MDRSWGHIQALCQRLGVTYPSPLSVIDAAVLADVDDATYAKTLTLACQHYSSLVLLGLAKDPSFAFAEQYFPLEGYYGNLDEKLDALLARVPPPAGCFVDRDLLLTMLPLLYRTEHLLTLGGDDRTNLTLPSLRNKYYTSPIPLVAPLSIEPASQPAAVLCRGSCTASPLSLEGLLLAHSRHAELLRAMLMHNPQCNFGNPPAAGARRILDQAFCAVRRRIGRLLLPECPEPSATVGEDGIGPRPEPSRAHVLLSPSGTDAEYWALMAATAAGVCAAQGSWSRAGQGMVKLSDSQPRRVRVLSVVVAGGEVGSGTAAATAGLHFSPLVPLPPPLSLAQASDSRSNNVAADLVHLASLAGAVLSIEVVVVPARGGAGSSGGATTDEELMAAVRRALLAGARNGTGAGDEQLVLLLHCVEGSKTGLSQPSSAALGALRAEMTQSGCDAGAGSSPRPLLLCCWDICQMRIGQDRLAALVAGTVCAAPDGGSDASMLLLTGSKFYGGPPFSGACVLGPELLAGLETLCRFGLWKGLGGLLQFAGPELVPQEAQALRSWLGGASGRNNPALLLRWLVALETMEALLPASASASASGSCSLSLLCDQWADGVRGMARARGLALWAEPDGPDSDSDPKDGAKHGLAGTIINILVPVPAKGSAMEGAKAIHRQLALGLWGRDGEARACVVLGQPVLLRPGSSGGELVVLRVALGAAEILRAARMALCYGSCSGPGSGSGSDSGSDPGPESVLNLPLTGTGTRAGAEAGGGAIFSVSVGVVLDWLWREDQQCLDALVNCLVPAPTKVMHSLSSRMADLSALAPHAPAKSAAGTRTSFSLSLLPSALASIRGTGATIDARRTEEGQGEGEGDSLVLYDLRALDNSFYGVQRAFAAASVSAMSAAQASPILHCLAIKSAPCSFLLHRALSLGLGLEAASWTECLHALALGCPPSRLVYDSPCKSDSELRAALEAGCVVNLNSLGEVDRVGAILTQGGLSSRPSPLPVVGLRVNPLVGCGAIKQLSTATVGSKFGVPFIGDWDQDQDQHSPHSPLTAAQIVALFNAHPFLSALHVHSGSQGLSHAQLVEGEFWG